MNIRDWSSDVCSSDLQATEQVAPVDPGACVRAHALVQLWERLFSVVHKFLHKNEGQVGMCGKLTFVILPLNGQNLLFPFWDP